jgi:signal peptidase I
MLSNNVVSGEVVVPAGKYFVLGDNRDQSLDSRYWGFVDAGDILGKPVFVYYSADSGDQVTGGVQFAWQRHVRWGRTFRFL